MQREWMRWMQKHHDYFARFKASQYKTWYDELIVGMGADDAMMCDAVDEMIRSGFSGYLEGHFMFFRKWISERKRCPLCNNSGAVRVPDRRPSRAGNSMHVLCCCPLQPKGRTKLGDNAATLEQYERKYGTAWRDPPGVQRQLKLAEPDDGIAGTGAGRTEGAELRA